MLVTITCANSQCAAEIGRSDVAAANVPNYVAEVSRQQVQCPKCQGMGAAKVEVLEESAPPTPAEAPAAPEPAPEAEGAADPEESAVPDALPEDFNLDAPISGEGDVTIDDGDDNAELPDSDREDDDINPTNS